MDVSRSVLLVQNVSKIYRLYRQPSDRIVEYLRLSTRTLHSDFWALRNVSFTVDRGEFLALVGPNGCGKSTLLQVVSGILQPTHGQVVRRGRVAALLELGAGFNPEFTGRENVLINGELLGLSRSEMLKALPRIEEFAGIGEFIDRPVKEYSSGMYVRLAFSTAIHVDPEILIIDEALAVGDAAFANQCVRKFHELKQRQTTVLFVSHDMGLVKQLADRAIFLLNGQMQAQGHPKTVIDRYFATVLDRQVIESDPVRGKNSLLHHRHGDGSSEILGIRFLNHSGDDCALVQSGEPLNIRITVRCRRDLSNPMVGILVRSRVGMEVYGTNTRVEGIELGEFRAGDQFTVEFRFACWLTPQQYSLTVATQNFDGTSQDWVDDAVVFDVISTRQVAGVADLRAEVSWSRLPN